MGDKGSQRKEKKSPGASGQAAYALVKATAAEKKAQATLADANKKLSAAIRALQQAKAGKSEERKAERAVRAAVNGLVRAKRKLKKAQKKRMKASAKQTPKPPAQPAARAAKKPKSVPAAGGRARRPARASRQKPRRVAAERFKPTPEPTQAEDRGAETVGRDRIPAQPVADLGTDV